MQKFITDIKSLATLLMAGAAFAACSSEDNMIGGQPASQQTYTMTIEASKGGGSDATTRALSIDGSGALNATWETSNEVKAYNHTQSSALTGSLKPQSDGASATLTGSLTGSVAVNDIIFLRWPSVDADYTGQDGTLETIAQRYDYTTGVAKVTSIDGTTIGAEDSSHGGPVRFTNSQAIVKFTLIDKATDAPIRATQLTIDAKFNGESRLIQSITYPDAYTLGPITIDRTAPADNVIYAALPFSSQAKFTFALTATDGTNTYTYEKADVTMLNGRYYEITVKMNASQATPLTFEAKEAGASVTFKTYTGSTVSAPEYSTDGSNWTHYTWGTAITLANVGDKVMFRGDNATYAASSGTDAVSTFTCDKDCYVYGNVMSLVSSTGYESATTLTAGSTFRRLFYRNTHLLNHPTKPIVLPATTLADNCYFSMFEGCSGLTKAPTLPATTMKPGCYMQMFSEAGIAVAPALPSTTLAQSCYEMMFYECPNLTMPPGLPATKLETLCYAAMFALCPNLETAPALPATTLVNSCYYGMFSGCTKLNNVTCLATNISANNCTYGWLTGVAATGTFTKAGEMTGWTTGGNGIPEGWTVNDARGHALASSAVGEIVGSDGLAYYASDKDNLPSGVTAVAMIAYKSETAGESLAIQLNASPASMSWSDACNYSSYPSITGNPGTWRLPSMADWQNMFVGCAKSGDAGAGDNMEPIAGFKEKIGATGITWQSDAPYWSRTGSESGAWLVSVYLVGGNAVAYFGEFDSSDPYYVLGCLAF
jgi:hypothetical protein